MSLNKLFLISILIGISLNESAPKPVEELTCGKSSPKKETDCTKYGTGSGMLCCWVSESKKDTNGKCYLLPQTLAESDTHGINGEKLFQNSTDGNNYWSCGNKSNFMSINIIILLLVLFSL